MTTLAPRVEQTPAELEQELRALLRNVRLVGELDLALEGDVYLGARSVCAPLITRRTFHDLARIYPASLVIFLVAEGRHRYRGGTFWPNISLPGNCDANETSSIGRAFLYSLKALQLETFKQEQLQEHGLRYIMPILLHGGIPYDCAGDVWQLLLREIRDGADDGEQLVANWRNRRHLMDELRIPAQRFLRLGREFATDLIERMIDLAEFVAEIGQEEALDRGAAALATESGLPSYLAEALLDPSIPKSPSGPRLPRPRVLIDPYAGEGPSVLLPATGSQRYQEGRWKVTIGRNTKSYKISSFDEREVPLDPSQPWQIVIDTGSQSRSSLFVGFERSPVYFFATRTGELLRDQRNLQLDHVLALAPKATEFHHPDTAAPIPEFQELPPLSGTWSTWSLRELDLRGLHRFRVVLADPTGGLQDEFVFVAAGSIRPRFSDEPLRGILDLGGRSVFSAPPCLHVDPGRTSLSAWRVRFRSTDLDIRCTLADLPRDGDDFQLQDVLLPYALLAGELSVLGPLGSDFRTGLALVPDLQIHRPDRIVSPSESVQLTLSARGVLLNNALDRLILTFQPGKDSLPVEVRQGNSQVTLLVTVPRLLWMVRKKNAGAGSFGRDLLTIDLDEMQTGEAEALLVRVRRTASLQLHLIGDELVLQSSDWVITGGTDGRWTFPLASFAQTIAQAGLARLHLRLVTEGLQIDVAAIEARYEVSDISVESAVSGAERFTCCEVSFRENHPFRDREIRMWSRTRPWERPIRIPINERNHNSCFFSVDDSVPAGPYLLEIAVRNPWVLPTRPGHRDPNVAKVQVGTHNDLALHLGSLNPSLPLEALELVMCDRQIPVAEIENNAAHIFNHLVASMLTILDEWDVDALDRPAYKALSEVTFAQPELLGHWLVDDASDRMGSEDLLRFAIATLPDILDCLPVALEPRDLDRLWGLSPVFGAAFALYRVGETAVAACWQHFAGWDPAMPLDEEIRPEEEDRLPSRGGPIDAILASLPPSRLRELAIMLRPDEVKPLRWIGYLEGAFELLCETWPDREAIQRWRSAYSRLNDRRARQEPVHETYLDSVEPGVHAPTWCRFPQDLLASAFHLVAFSGQRKEATSAMWAACSFAPKLTERSLLLAIAIHRLGM